MTRQNRLSLRMSDLKAPALVAIMALTVIIGINRLLQSPAAAPERWLSAVPASKRIPQPGLHHSLRPHMRPRLADQYPGGVYIPEGGIPCLRRGLVAGRGSLTYVSTSCMFFGNIHRDRFPPKCLTHIPNVDGGKGIYPVSCLIRVGLLDSGQKYDINPAQP